MGVTTVAGRARPGRGLAGSCSWHSATKPLLIINLGSSDKKRRISTFRPPPQFLFSVSLDVSHPRCPLLKCIFALAGLSLWFLFFLSPKFYFTRLFSSSPSPSRLYPRWSVWLAAPTSQRFFLFEGEKKKVPDSIHTVVIPNEKKPKKGFSVSNIWRFLLFIPKVYSPQFV